jgi:hypothetical protein
MPFELFESVLTHEAYRALEASGSTAASSSSSAAAGPSSHGHGHAHGSAAAWRGAHSGSSGGHGHEHKGGQGELLVDNELGFAKDRTISRLTEMQSLEYLAAHAEAHEPSLMAALREALDKKASAAAAAAGAPRAAVACTAAVCARPLCLSLAAAPALLCPCAAPPVLLLVWPSVRPPGSLICCIYALPLAYVAVRAATALRLPRWTAPICVCSDHTTLRCIPHALLFVKVVRGLQGSVPQWAYKQGCPGAALPSAGHTRVLCWQLPRRRGAN